MNSWSRTEKIAKEYIIAGLPVIPDRDKNPQYKSGWTDTYLWNCAEKLSNYTASLPYRSTDEKYPVSKNDKYLGLAVVCSDIVVIDIDVDQEVNGKDQFNEFCESEGNTTLNALLKEYVSDQSPSGGHHLFFLSDNDTNLLRNGEIDYINPSGKIEFKGRGTKVTISPTTYCGCVQKKLVNGVLNYKDKLHKCGVGKDHDKCKFKDIQYKWINDPRKVPLKPMPEFLKIAIRNSSCQKKSEIKSEDKDDIESKSFFIKINSEYFTQMFKLFSKEKSIETKHWKKIIFGLKNAGATLEQAHEFSKYAGESYSKDGVESSWNSINSLNLNQKIGLVTLNKILKKDIGKEAFDNFKKDYFICDNEDDINIFGNSIGLSKLFAKEKKSIIKIIDSTGKGYIWSYKNKLWEEVEGIHIKNMIPHVLLPYITKCIDRTTKDEEKKKEVESDEESDSDEEEKKKPKKDDKDGKLRYLRGMKKKLQDMSNTKAIMDQLITLLKDDKIIEQINRDPNMLPISKGKIIDLRNGEVRDRDLRDLFSLECPVSYNKNESYPNAEKFFMDIASQDKDLRDYLRVFCSYCLTGLTKERNIWIHNGRGSNGKTTLWDIMSKILGSFLVYCAPEVILKRDIKSKGPTPELIPLIHARVAVLSEIEANEKLNTKRVKEISSGGDKMSARAVYGRSQIEFTPQFKMILMTNDKPSFDCSDQAMIDRVRLIPANARFEGTKASKEYIDNLKTTHLSEIFSYLIDGGISYHNSDNGLLTPKICEDGMKEYRKEINTIESFISDCCIISKDLSCKAADLYPGYLDYCKSEKLTTNVKKKFFEYFSIAYPKIEMNKAKKIDGKVIKCHIGIKINYEEDEMSDIPRE